MQVKSLLFPFMLIGSHAIAQDEDEFIQFSVACAAFLSVSASQMDSGPLSDFIKSDADWYADMARELVAEKFAYASDAELRDLGINNTDEIAILAITKGLQTVRQAYNDGTYSWDDIVDSARNCSEQKRAIIRELESPD